MEKCVLPPVPEVLLQLLPEFREAHEIMESNTLTLEQAIEITIPPQSAAVRILIEEYLQSVEDDAEYLTEYIPADNEVPDKDQIHIFRMPWNVVLQWGMKQGLTANS